MSLSYTLAAMPLWASSLLTVVIPTLVAAAAPWLVRRKVPLERLTRNNEVAGFKYAALSVIYGVFLGFVVVAIWEDFRNAQDYTRREADALLGLHRFASGADATAKPRLQQALQRYARAVIDDEWTTMQRGRASPEAHARLLDLFRAYQAIEPDSLRAQILYSASLTTLGNLNENRRERLTSAAESLPGLMWFLLIVGAVSVVGFTLFFGAPSVRVQAAMTGMICLMVTLVLFTILNMDHPFTGDVSVSPHAFQQALELMAHEP